MIWVRWRENAANWELEFYFIYWELSNLLEYLERLIKRQISQHVIISTEVKELVPVSCSTWGLQNLNNLKIWTVLTIFQWVWLLVLDRICYNIIKFHSQICAPDLNFIRDGKVRQIFLAMISNCYWKFQLTLAQTTISLFCVRLLIAIIGGRTLFPQSWQRNFIGAKNWVKSFWKIRVLLIDFKEPSIELQLRCFVKSIQNLG